MTETPDAQGTRTISIAPMPEMVDSKWLTVSVGKRHWLCYTTKSPNVGPEFFISRGGRRKLESFAGDQAGWAKAWDAFSALEPRIAAAYSEEAQKRQAAARSRQLPSRYANALTLMRGATYLGGYGTPLVTQGLYDLVFLAEGVVFEKSGTAIHEIAYREVANLTISGRGRLTEGGGFLGGGFGVQGALEGMAIATVLNALTTRTRMETVLTIEGREQELFFHYELATPEQLRIGLSSVFGRVKNTKALEDNLTPPLDVAASPTSDVVERLERLGSMHAQGLLTADEFSAAKSQLLGSPLGDVAARPRPFLLTDSEVWSSGQ
jgi:hypothetical protein